MEKQSNADRVLVKKAEGKRSLGIFKCRWEDNILYLKKTEWEGVDWNNLAQNGGKFVSCCEHDTEVFCSTNCVEFLE
jgi:hypothetical protein